MIIRRINSDYAGLNRIDQVDWDSIVIPRFGTSGADTMHGSSGKDHFYGYGSSDTFIGNGGVDTFNGGDGTDTVDYSNVAERAPDSFSGLTGVNANLESGYGGEIGEGADQYLSIENITGTNFKDLLIGNEKVNVLRGLGGDDIIRGGAGGDTLDGGQGDGIDTLSYFGSNTGVTINLQTRAASGGHAAGDVISGFENIVGSFHSDNLTGDNGDNVIEGDGGADILDGAGGLNDTVSYKSSNAGVVVDLTNRTARGGHAEGDILSGFENIEGSGRGDTLTGTFRDNVLSGGEGDDTLFGLRGLDTLEGGGGNDTMSGGLDVDTFVFNFNDVTGTDTITDFTFGQDKLVVDVEDPNVFNFLNNLASLDITFVQVNGDIGNLVYHLGGDDTFTLQNITSGDAGWLQTGIGVTFV